MKNLKSPLNEHPAIVSFGKSVSRLVMPSLAPLYQVVVDVRQGIQQERADINRQLDELQLEGFEAAARLCLLGGGSQPPRQVNYFDRINTRGGKKDE
jgi:hypothetical protein